MRLSPDNLVPLAKRGLRTVARDGIRETARRAVNLAHTAVADEFADLPLRADDIADSSRLRLSQPLTRPRAGTSLTIGWISTPPGLGSGGHTTMFRMIRGLEDAGHSCVLYLYDRFGGDLRAQTRVVRQGWPEVKATIRSVEEGIDGVDACLATSWQTAHVLARRGYFPMRRLYFVQDFEPFFFPRGSSYALAEDSYRFGFRCIALGHMVGDLLTTEVGIEPDVTEFGCDTSVYRLLDGPRAARKGVVFYTKPGVARRGYVLGRLALEEFHRRHPEEPIHVYGDTSQKLPFPAVKHSRSTTEDLNLLYNSAIAGLAMSFTNISLVAEEMLAAGMTPVVNDSPYSRADLSNPHVKWAAATPGSVADALSDLVTAPDIPTRATAAASSVRQQEWRVAQADVVRIVEHEVYGA